MRDPGSVAAQILARNGSLAGLAPTEAAVFVSTLPPGEPWEDIGAALLETPPARELSFIVEYLRCASEEEVCAAVTVTFLRLMSRI